MSYLDNKIEIHEKVLESLSRQVKFLIEMNEKKLNTTNHPEVQLPIAISISQEETNQTHVNEDNQNQEVNYKNQDFGNLKFLSIFSVN
jgi:hypothetical protein